MAEFADLVLFFSLYSFLGWMLEIAYSNILNGKQNNRVFLFGPFCPLYGVGALIILFITNIINSLFTFKSFISLTIILILSIILVSILEYITGFILEKAFGTKLWDYSREAFNLHGRICLKYSLLWGFLAFLLLTVIHPFINRYVVQIQFATKSTISFSLILYFAVDTYLSVRKHYIERRLKKC